MAAAGSKGVCYLDQELDWLDIGIAVHRDSEIGVQNIVGRRAGAEYAQAQTDVAEPPRIHRVFVRSAPRTADIVEGGAADAEQAKRIPVTVNALFHGNQRSPVAALVSEGIAAHTVVAP